MPLNTCPMGHKSLFRSCPVCAAAAVLSRIQPSTRMIDTRGRKPGQRVHDYPNETGNRYGRLTVLHRANHIGENRGVYWACKCDCGGEKTVSGCHLRRRQCRSCGCMEIERRARGRVITLTPEDKARCKRIADKIQTKARAMAAGRAF